MRHEIQDPNHPMTHARRVRAERYAWPGGYPLALVVDDAASLCADCVSANWQEISSANRNKDNNGWRPVCFVVVEEPEQCAHCNATIGESNAN